MLTPRLLVLTDAVIDKLCSHVQHDSVGGIYNNPRQLLPTRRNNFQTDIGQLVGKVLASGNLATQTFSSPDSRLSFFDSPTILASTQDFL